MSSHEGVSCDSCLKGNFTGKRYKCLICYDYDLCSACYEAKIMSAQHSADHPMQCILTQTDIDLFYGGETSNLDQQMSFTCPLCGRLGFTDVLLQEHVGIEHADTSSSVEVVCPICASFPSGDSNHGVDDLAAHLLLEHRSSMEIDAELGNIRAIRRMPHHSRSGVGSTRTTRRGNIMQFQSTSGTTFPVLSPGGGHEMMDPIAELLSQLSSARSRMAAAQSISSQLHQLEIQLHSAQYGGSGSSRQPPSERLIPSLGEMVHRNAAIPVSFSRLGGLSTVPTESLTSAIGFRSEGITEALYAAASSASSMTQGNSTAENSHSNFLLSRLREQRTTEVERKSEELNRADKTLFCQDLLLALWSTETCDKEEERLERITEYTLAAPLVQTADALRQEAPSTLTPLHQQDGTQLVSTVARSTIDQPILAMLSVGGVGHPLQVNNSLTLAEGKFLSTRNAAKLKGLAIAKRH